jgi:hypothetical protein
MYGVEQKAVINDELEIILKQVTEATFIAQLNIYNEGLGKDI